MSNIFISCHHDDYEVARKLEARMLQKGHRTRIPVGSAVAGIWRIKYSKALAAADVLIVMLGEQGLESKNVLGEIGAGRVLEQARNTLVLPVLLGRQNIPGFMSDLFCFELPDPTQEAALDELADKLQTAINDNIKRNARLFISHRHRDRAVAAALLKLIEAAFEVSPNDIRCTSAPPYMLAPGEKTSDQLRSDLASAELVVGLLSPDTSESNYVLCELGAAWGREVATFPLLARGARFEDVPSPLNERHSMSLESTDNCLQLIDYIASKTTLEKRTPAVDLTGLAASLAVEARTGVPVRQEWEYVHTSTKPGPVWIRLQSSNEFRSVSHELYVRWGDSLYACELAIPPKECVYLTHDREKPDLAPLRLRVVPACEASFGDGLPPPDRRTVEIRKGWRRIEYPAGMG